MLQACLTAAAVSDWKTGRIPNALSAAAALAGCGYFLAAGKGSEAGLAAARCLMVLTCLFPLYLFRMVGAGDIKMMAGMAACLSIGDWTQAVTAALILAGIWSAGVMWRKRLAAARIRYLIFYLGRFLRTRERIPYRTDAEDPNTLLCLGPFLWAGTTLFLMMEGAG